MAKYNFKKEAELTNEQLAGELAKISPLSESDINKLLPERVDKERLQKLINIVNNTATEENKLSSIRENVTELGGVILKLLSKFINPL